MAPPKNFGSLRTRSTTTLPEPQNEDDGLIVMLYDDAPEGPAPIAVTVAPPRPENEKDKDKEKNIHPLFRRRPTTGLEDKDNSKRDSGLAPTTSSKAREGSVNTIDELATNVLGFTFDFDSPAPAANTNAPHTPTSEFEIQKSVKSEAGASNGMSRWKTPGSRAGSLQKTRKKKSSPFEELAPITITTTIPTDRLLEEDFLEQLSFSKRGSMMLGGRKAVNGHARLNGGLRQPSFSLLISPFAKVLSEDDELESQKVRSMYETGTKFDWRDGKSPAMESKTTINDTREEEIPDKLLNPGTDRRPESAMSTMSTKGQHELAGGIEDWEDVNNKDVDRYGFISLRRNASRAGSPEPRPPQRTSTVLQLASEAPRRKRAFGRNASTSSQIGSKRYAGRKPSAKSLNTQNTQTTHASNNSRRSNHSGMRAATNRLPGNRDRRWMDEAGDMLTLPPGLADIEEDEDGGRAAEGLKKKEWERSEKWRKMAKISKTGKDGQGMKFEFNTQNPKLIERTWKGIPDRWRGAAWYSFLSTSAKRSKGSATDEAIIDAFHESQQASSADDVQIDIDVPRTINSHIMFRRRYRGGQRLLFRVLHALSLYFPDTGYVQGMASLAATLLCYYDEEKTFVMLVRMWTLRGLSKLYESGFAGLMAALDEFRTQWMVGRPVSKKLDELNIEPTAYGTRWYLTLFNYSIPFPAQLRVWDVFMLLGDSDLTSSPSTDRPFAGGLDVLHATSAALIDGTREILLDSDFENAMKALTSWIPVKDEELLMKVAKAEWKLHRGKKKS